MLALRKKHLLSALARVVPSPKVRQKAMLLCGSYDVAPLGLLFGDDRLREHFLSVLGKSCERARREPAPAASDESGPQCGFARRI